MGAAQSKGQSRVRPALVAALALLAACSQRVAPIGDTEGTEGTLASPGAASTRASTDTLSAAAARAKGTAAPDGFDHTVERFADVRVLRYRVPGFDALPLAERRLLYYLQEACLSGRDILYAQRYEHNLAVRRTLEAVLDTYRGKRSTSAFKGLLTYAKQVWFATGIHHPATGTKMIPEGLTAADFAQLVQGADARRLPLGKGQSVGEWIERMTPVIFDPNVAPRARVRGPRADPVADSISQFYLGVRTEEAKAFYAERSKLRKNRGLPLGLNSQLVKTDAGLFERVWKVSGLYGEAIREMVRWLALARDASTSDPQKRALSQLIAFYETGDLRSFESHSIAWLADPRPAIELSHGFLETYDDPIARKGSYGALLGIDDPVGSDRVTTLGEHAQWFEDHAPIEPGFRKVKAIGIKAQAIFAIVAAGDNAPTLPVGINLPNLPWLRLKHGSRSLTLSNILEAHAAARRDSGVLGEFAVDAREVQRERAFGGLARALLVDLHEVVGHASGKLAKGVAPPNETLAQYAGTIEEARAELFALYYLFDAKLIELKLMPSFEVARAGYDGFIRDALLLNLAGLQEGARIEDAHLQASRLAGMWVLKQPEGAAALERVERKDKTYYRIKDYGKLRKLFGRLLAEVQRIASEGDFEAARQLIEEHAVHVEPGILAQVRKRLEALGVSAHVAFVQPRLVPMRAGETIQDVRLDYPSDFASQQLADARRYNFLPTYSPDIRADPANSPEPPAGRGSTKSAVQARPRTAAPLTPGAPVAPTPHPR